MKNQINNYINVAYFDMVEKGFYICSNCNGSGRVLDPILKNKSIWKNKDCSVCKGIGRYEDKGLLLSLISSELYEALKAHRNNKFAIIHKAAEKYIINKFNPTDMQHRDWFRITIKDTFEDEIADIILRIFNFMGYLKYKYKKTNIPFILKSDNIPSQIRQIDRHFVNIDEKYSMQCDLSAGIDIMFKFANYHKIDIWRFIDLKMIYNRIRPKKHGKRY